MADISKINGYELKDAVARQDIAGMKDGSIMVERASTAGTAHNAANAVNAMNATKATTASNYDSSNGTIMTKFTSVDSSIDDITADIASLTSSVANLTANKNNGFVFKNYEEMITSLLTTAQEAENIGGETQEQLKAKYKVGDTLFLKETNNPDYWVTQVVDMPILTRDEVGNNTDPEAEDSVVVGYWAITKIETEIDLLGYSSTSQTVSSIEGVTSWETDEITYKKANNASATFKDHKTKVVVEPSGGLSGISSDSGGTRTYTISQKAATPSQNGYMTKEQAEKLSGITADADAVELTNAATSGTKVADLTINGTTTTLYAPNGYTLPLATEGVRGGVKVGGVRSTAVTPNAASTTSGRYYAVERDSSEKIFVNVPWENTTYALATQSANGLMSGADKTKLDHIAISVSGEEMTITLA